MELTPHQAKYFALELTRLTASDDMQKLVPSHMGAKVDFFPQKVQILSVCTISKFNLRFSPCISPSDSTSLEPQLVLGHFNRANKDQI